MKWEDVRRQYAEKWVVFEALSAHTDQDICHIDDLAVIECFSNSRDAMGRQHELHKRNPGREYYFFHTSRETLDVIERPWVGIRGTR